MKKKLYFSVPLIGMLVILTTISCTTSNNDSSFQNSESGTGGSMARFTIAGNYLYTVDSNNLKTFSLENPSQPRYLKEKDADVGFGIETIFVLDTLLLIGAQDGMHIYNIKRPEFPQFMSTTSHIRSCDPVVASGNYAYVTLNSNNVSCGRGINVLQIYDISDPTKPVLEKTVEGLKGPQGLGVDGCKLFVCDNGLKIYDIENPKSPIWKNDLSTVPEASGINAYDVIPLNGILLLTGNDGLYQFAYATDDNSDFSLKFLSKMEVNL